MIDTDAKGGWLFDLQFRNYLLLHIMFGLIMSDINRFFQYKKLHLKKVNFGLFVSFILLTLHLIGSKYLELMPYNHIGLKWLICVLAMLGPLGFRYAFIERMLMGRSFFTVPKIINENDPDDNDMVLPEGLPQKVKSDIFSFARRTKSLYWAWYLLLFILLVVVYPIVMHFVGAYCVDYDRIKDSGDYWWHWVTFALYVGTTLIALVVFVVTLVMYVGAFKRGSKDVWETAKGVYETGTEALMGRGEGISDEKKTRWKKYRYRVGIAAFVYFLIALVYMIGVYHIPYFITILTDSIIVSKGKYDTMDWWTGPGGVKLARRFWEIIWYGVPVLILFALSTISVIVLEIAKPPTIEVPDLYENELK